MAECQALNRLAKGAFGRQTVFFSGAIDDVRIHNRALTEDEILALYGEGGRTGPEQ